MSPLPACARALSLIALIMLVAGLTAAQAQHPAGPHRPVNVPAEYVVTPFGYFHPSCVNHLAKDDEVLKEDMAIRHADGSVDSIQACAYPHFNHTGEPAQNRPAVQNPTISGWVEDASVTTTSTYGEITAKWLVPKAPTTNHGQIIYFFPGFEDAQHVVTILQPVLEWYNGTWTISSWNCCVSGAVNQSTPVSVKAGDTIYGAVWHTCAPGTFACPTWIVQTQDLTTGTYTQLTNTSSQGQVFNWAFAGVLEAYYVSQCSDYPAGGSMSFHDLVLTTNGFVLIPNPNWSVVTIAGLTPQCSYSQSLPKQLTLSY